MSAATDMHMGEAMGAAMAKLMATKQDVVQV